MNGLAPTPLSVYQNPSLPRKASRTDIAGKATPSPLFRAYAVLNHSPVRNEAKIDVSNEKPPSGSFISGHLSASSAHDTSASPTTSTRLSASDFPFPMTEADLQRFVEWSISPTNAAHLKSFNELSGDFDARRLVEESCWRLRALNAEDANVELTAEIKALKTKCAHLKSENQQLRVDSASSNAENEKTKAELALVTAKHTTLQTVYTTLLDATEEMGVSEKQVLDRTNEAEDRKTANEVLKAENQQLRDEYASIKADCEQAKAELASKDKKFVSMQSKYDSQLTEVNEKLENERGQALQLKKAIYAINFLACLRELARIIRMAIRKVIKSDVPLANATQNGMEFDDLAEAAGNLVDENRVAYQPTDLKDIARSLQLMSHELNQFLHAFRPANFVFAFKLWRNKVLSATCASVRDSTKRWIDATLHPVVLQLYEKQMKDDAKKWNKQKTRLMQESGQVLYGIRTVPTSFTMTSCLPIPQCLTNLSWLPDKFQMVNGHYKCE